jgi:hypothetical protein
LRAVGGNGPTLIILGEALQNAFTLSATIKMAAAK